MFKRQYRLLARAKLTGFSSHKIPSLKLMIAKNSLSYNRYGFVIGKKIDKRAVVRNRTKRVVRSCLEELHRQINKGYDMLFILQKNAVGRNREEIYKEIEDLLKKIKLL